MTGHEDAEYEWLLSDHPDARSERERMREAYFAERMGDATKILAWVRKIEDAPDAMPTIKALAETMGPIAKMAIDNETASFAVPDEEFVARERKVLEAFRDDYRYPAHLTGPEAENYPRPEPPQPEAEAEAEP